MHKVGQSGKFLGRLSGPLLKTVFPLIGNTFTPLAKRVLIPLELTEAASAADTAIHKKMLGSDTHEGLNLGLNKANNIKNFEVKNESYYESSLVT